MSGIKRFLPNNEYQAATNSPTQATLANPFVTVADLPAVVPAQDLATTLAVGNTTGSNDISINSGRSVKYNNGGFVSTIATLGLTASRAINFPDNSGTVALLSDIPAASGDGIYDGSGTIPTTTTSIVTDVFGFELTDVTDKFWIGENGFTPITSIHFHARDTAGVYIEGFNGSDGASALRVWNNGRTVKVADFENNGDIILSPTVGGISMGTATPIASTVVTIKGRGNTSATKSLIVENLAGTDALHITDDSHVGFGGAPSSTYRTYISNTSGKAGGMLITATGLTSNGDGLKITATTTGGESRGIFATAIAASGQIARGVYGNAENSAHGQSYGVYGRARNATATVAAIFGIVPGDSVNPSNYTIAVYGKNESDTDDNKRGVWAHLTNGVAGGTSYGLRADVSNNNISSVVNYGVWSKAFSSDVNSLNIAGYFETNAVGTNYAIVVPNANGQVLFGATTAVNSDAILEVTGQIQMNGNGTGFYMFQPDATRRLITLSNAGAFVIT